MPRRFLHRQIWQRLPQRWRRSLLFRATARAAPRPDPLTQPALPFIVAGVLRSSSGLGQAARLAYEALERAGAPVYGLDLTTDLMQPADRPDFSFRDGSGFDGAATLLLHVNGMLVPLAMLRMGRRFVAQKHVIGCWAWELPDLPSEWQPGFQFLHAVCVPSAFTAAAIRQANSGKPVHVLPHPLSHAPLTPGRRSPPGQPFTILTVFDVASSFARKNPLASIAAFRAAFGNSADARLIVKSARADHYPQAAAMLRAAIDKAENIHWIDGVYTPPQMQQLYAQADAVISLHRSEGFGLTLAEAMLSGIPTIATGWSGNLEFQTQNTAALIGFDLIPAHDPQRIYHHPEMMWAEAHVEEAAAALRRLATDDDYRRELSVNGQAMAQDKLNPSVYCAILQSLTGQSLSVS